MDSKSPKLNLADYLPAIFNSEKDSTDPLRAILDIAENIFNRANDILDKTEIYFDPDTAPSEPDRDFLSWLALWVDLNLFDDWSDLKKRRILKNVANLYKLRGTVHGLRYMIEQFFDVKAKVEEWKWPGMIIGVYSTINIDTIIRSAPDHDHYFMVTCWCTSKGQDKSELEHKISKLINNEKPAHTIYYLNII